MPVFLGFVYVFDGDHDAGLFHIAKVGVDAGWEGFHGRAGVHVRIEQWRNVLAEFPDLCVQQMVSFFVFQCLYGFQEIRRIVGQGHRIFNPYQVFFVREIVVHKGDDEVSGFAVEVGVHGYFSEEVIYFRVQNN